MTGNRAISTFSSYWTWMRKRGHTEAAPWAGQSLAKPPKHRGRDDSKRPFTAEEVAALLAGDPGQELADAIRAAALSGMRLEEMYRLTVADCAGGWLRISASKSDAGVRRVPIHPALAARVAQRTDGKAPGDFLFHEAGPARPGRERSAAASKRFGRYRQAVGVHDRAEGKRHSAVDFHSWRRWFITEAERAGQPPHVIASVVGHERTGMTLGTYSAGPSDDQLRACVEAVRLP